MYDISNTIYIINSNEFRGKIENELFKSNIVKKFIVNNVLSKEQIKIYKNTHDDLHNLSEIDAQNHYKKHVCFENKSMDGYVNIFIYYEPNTPQVCHEKWNNCLRHINNDNQPHTFTHFILTNDSVLITRTMHLCPSQMNTNEMIGLIDSYEIMHHYPDFFRIYNTTGIAKWIKFYNLTNPKCVTFDDMINKMEIDSTFITNKRDCIYKMSKNYTKNIHFDNINNARKKFMQYYTYPIIKLKALQLIHYERIPLDFNAISYKQLNPDLINLTDRNAYIHFYRHGWIDGRRYKYGQPSHIPDDLTHLIPNHIKLVV
jgi:hypothetical protein